MAEVDAENDKHKHIFLFHCKQLLCFLLFLLQTFSTCVLSPDPQGATPLVHQKTEKLLYSSCFTGYKRRGAVGPCDPPWCIPVEGGGVRPPS